MSEVPLNFTTSVLNYYTGVTWNIGGDSAWQDEKMLWGYGELLELFTR